MPNIHTYTPFRYMPLTVSVARLARVDNIGIQQLPSTSVSFRIMDTVSQRLKLVQKTCAE